jgi:hypothetical protein
MNKAAFKLKSQETKEEREMRIAQIENILFACSLDPTNTFNKIARIIAAHFE